MYLNKNPSKNSSENTYQMSVRCHVVISGVDKGLRSDTNLKHGRSQHVARVVSLDLQLLVDFCHLKFYHLLLINDITIQN